MSGVMTYYQLLEMYCKDMQMKIQPLNPGLLNESVFLFEVGMTPEKQTWKYGLMNSVGFGSARMK